MLQVVRDFIAAAWLTGSKSIRSREQKSFEESVSGWFLITLSAIALVGHLGIIEISLNITGVKI
jgi:hypothetical protein